MCEQGASDLHLCVGMPPLVRKDGSIQLLGSDTPALDPATVASLLEPIIPGANREAFERPIGRPRSGSCSRNRCAA
jgi:Tfp pilus assembly pilus retraction ATPase PilT